MSQIQDTNATGDQDVNNNTQWNNNIVLKNSGDNVESIDKECEQHDETKNLTKQENPPSKVVHLRNLPLSSNSSFNYHSNYNYCIQNNDDVEGDIIQTAFKYGTVIDILMMRKTGQAFLEMETLEQAQTFVNNYKDRTIHIGTHSVYVQFSKHPRLKGIDNNSHQSAIRKRLEDAKNGKFYKQTRHYKNYNDGFRQQNNNNNISRHQYQNSPNNYNKQQINNENRRVLHVTVEEDNYASIGIHQYYQLFSKQVGHGKVLRIVMYHNKKQNVPRSTQQILIEMIDAESAQEARRLLNGQMMYQGSHMMRIDFSHHAELNVKADDEQRWDYMRTPINRSESEQNKMQNLSTSYNHNNFQPINNHRNINGNNNFQTNPQTHSNSWSPNDRALNIANSTQMNNVNFNHQNSNQNNNCNSNLGNAPSNSPNINSGGNIHGGNINLNTTQSQATNYYSHQNNYTQQNMTHRYNQPSMQQQYCSYGNGPYLSYDRIQNQHNYYRTNNHLASPNSQYNNQIYYDSKPNMHSHNHYNINQHHFNNPANNHHHYHAHKNNLQHDPRFNNYGNYIPNYNTVEKYGLVLCASNLNEETTKPDDLFILFGVYGDVVRVKILYEKRDTALIEFTNSMQANQALRNLNGKKLYGKELKIKISKFQKVNMPKEGSDTFKLTKEYLNSALHRYKKPGSKNYSNIYEPCDVLHLSNIPEGYTKEKMEAIFENHGTIKKLSFFKDPKMALIQMANVEEAINCLIKTHNHPMKENQHLRVSFSRGYLPP